MNSGLRDVHNLAWKLAAVLRGDLGSGLLETYERERREHAAAMIRLALQLGRIMVPRNRVTGLLTRLAFHMLGVYPPARNYIAEMRYRPQPRFAAGFIVPNGTASRKTLVGKLFLQPHIFDRSGSRLLLDEVVGNRFALLAYTPRPRELFARLTQDVWSRLGVVRVAILPPASALEHIPDVLSVRAADESLLNIFPAHVNSVVLLRPDHYVASHFSAIDASASAAAVEQLVSQSWMTPSPKAADSSAACSQF
jgi:3-(3-hydroxy-phenyl)propionate hydroxylase